MDHSVALSARLENYTLRFPGELLLVQAEVDGEEDTVIIFKGFSSSLARPTAYDPEVPTLPARAVIQHIDRLKGPYQSQSPEYIERAISQTAFVTRLASLGL